MHHAQDGIATIYELGVGATHEVDSPLCEPAEKGRFHAGRATEARRAADDAAEHVPSALIAGQHPIGYEERHSARVIGQHPKCNIDPVVVAEPLGSDLL